MAAERTEGKEEPIDIGAGLRLLRRRRWYLWGIILIYLPLMWSVLQIEAKVNLMAIAFGVWFVLLLAIALLVAVTRCPSCGNYFHVNGMTFLTLRKCLHCQLHLTADRQRNRP